ncbi:MAG: DNA topoisomerase [Lachnospiraceae bacterium]|nr:DNA topoisomerase [Lachnospiraceae bacterium]MDY5497853.1 DNA topoisomerase [Anaerobutyricum sp.]
MKKLIIAEKPSVAKNIADATSSSRRNGYFEGDDYVITWAFGHLLELYDAKDYDPEMKSWKIEKFPFIPEKFLYKLKSDRKNKEKPDTGVKHQMDIIKSLMERQDVEGIISATDDDREGQIIADEIIGYINPGKPVERILLNEWTADEVNRGLCALRPNEEMKPLQDAGFGRQLADWMIGINLTSVATLKYRNQKNVRLLNIGRVLMPTLKIIYDRDKEIADFKVTKYYKLKGSFETGDKKNFEGIYYQDKNEKFDSPEELSAIQKQIEGKQGKITSKKVVQKKEYPPYLFNLSGLQGYVTAKYKGWTSDKVLKTAQQLYEKKLITYPRTASVVLDESLKNKVAKVLSIHKKGCPFEEMIHFKATKRIFDSKKVESHSAIIPTYVLPNSLTQGEQIVYEAVRNRFLAQFMPIALAEDTTVHIKMEVTDLPGEFIARGKIQIEPGWKLIEGIDAKETILPPVEKGEQVMLVRSEINEVERKPPKPHTEKTLLKVMETCGKKYEEKDEEQMMMAILSGFSIGTPATRAETIKKLKDAGYIRAKGKSLTCTELGKQLVETFPVRELFDLEYTGRLEKTLSDIERKKFSKEEFLTMIKKFVVDSVEKIKTDRVFGGPVMLEPLHKEPVGICPECGAPVMETARAFGCSAWKKGCKFTIWKNDRFITSLGKKVSYEMVKILLEHGKVGFHGCVSKRGNKFSAYFYYEKDEKSGKYQWRLEFIDPQKTS